MSLVYAKAMKTLVLFDGVCNLCNGTVQFIIRHDKAGRFQFASQQSEAGQRILQQHGIPTEAALADSVVVIEEGRVWLESDAALHILYRLGVCGASLRCCGGCPRVCGTGSTAGWRKTATAFLAGAKAAWCPPQNSKSASWIQPDLCIKQRPGNLPSPQVVENRGLL
jgi:predicted DCC family thiol-disulfide oxidoreductase YuxK